MQGVTMTQNFFPVELGSADVALGSWDFGRGVFKLEDDDYEVWLDGEEGQASRRPFYGHISQRPCLKPSEKDEDTGWSSVMLWLKKWDKQKQLVLSRDLDMLLDDYSSLFELTQLLLRREQDHAIRLFEAPNRWIYVHTGIGITRKMSWENCVGNVGCWDHWTQQ